MKYTHTYATCLLLVFVPLVVRGADREDVPRLIRQLGAASYEERNTASELLWEIGEPASALLDEAANSDDPEISMRAREILKDITHGVRPSWPGDLRREIHRYDKLPAGRRKELVKQIVDTYKQEAVPFLLMRVTKGESKDASFVVDQLIGMDDSETWRLVLERVKEPVNKYQANILALAARKVGTSEDIVRTLKSTHLESGSRKMLADSGIRSLRKQMERFAFKAVLKTADDFSKVMPQDARFLYLQAAASTELGNRDKARLVLVRALSLNPESEAPHYTAATMLGEMGQYRLATLEWQKILKIPPEGDVYDINAYMRLGMIYAKNKMYSKAGDSYEAGLKLYRAARERHGKSMGMIGTDEEGLKKVIADCRAHAKAMGHDAEGGIQDAPKREHVSVGLEVIIKDDNANEMMDILSRVAVTVSANVKPHGFRLFEKTNAAVRYDSEKQMLVVLLNNSPCTKPVACKLREGKTCVAVDSLDMRYIYRVDRVTDEVKRVASYEKDYVLRVAPAKELRDWRDTAIRINNKEHTWKKLEQGIPFDFLPEKLVLKVQGIDPGGKKRRVEHTIDPRKLESECGKTTEPTAVGLKLRVVPLEDDDW